MSQASLLQLRANGVQSKYVHGTYNPFRCRITRSVSFATEPKRIDFDIAPTYGTQGKARITFSADALRKVYLVIEMNAHKERYFVDASTVDLSINPDGDTQNATGFDPDENRLTFAEDWGRAVIESCEVSIGGVTHNILYPELMHIMESQRVPPHLRDSGYMTGRTGSGDGITQATQSMYRNGQKFYIPLDFWFCNDQCGALPLSAMHLSECFIKIKFKQKSEVFLITMQSGSWTGNFDTEVGILNDVYLIGEYLYFDKETRKEYASTPHRFLIEQHQVSKASITAGTTKTRERLGFNHCVKEFVWFIRKESDLASNTYFEFMGNETGFQIEGVLNDSFKSAQLYLNSNPRFADATDPNYFRFIQARAHHACLNEAEWYYSYSFCLHPEDLNPSGVLNCSRIENIEMELEFYGYPEATSFSALTGTVDINSTTAVVGTGTLFTTELKVGDYVKVVNGGNTYYFTVASITDDTNIVATSALTATATTSSISKSDAWTGLKEDSTLHVYAVNYNVVEVVDGCCQLYFAS